MNTTSAASAAGQDHGRVALRTITLRLMPLFCLMYLIAYIDRQNVAYAKLQMADALGLSEAAYGLGSALFFIGYFLFEAPSNLILAKVGARVWFTRIMMTWGAITIALGFTSSPEMFYALRFLLGAAEAGFFPGVLYVLTLWYPQAHRARMIGMFMIASAVANAIGSAIGGALLDLNGFAGLAGWQWVFVATGIPAVALGPYVLATLPNGPDEARWLAQPQKDWIKRTLDAEHAATPGHGHAAAWRAIFDPGVVFLAVLYVGLPLGAYGLSYWLPTIVKGFGVSATVNGLLNVVPWTCAALALWLVPRHAARHGASSWHIAAPALTGAAALLAIVFVPGDAAKFALLCLAAAAILGGQPVFWSLPPTFLKGAGAAAGIAAINSVGNLGGFVAQTVVPLIRDRTGSTLAPMLFLSACLAGTAVLALIAVPMLRRRAGGP